MNWGKGIGLAYIGFIAFMIMMVYKSAQQELNLVTKDYYEKDLTFEDQRVKRVNTSAFEKEVAINHLPENETVTFQFPGEDNKAQGTILFFRPSDNKQDKTIQISANAQNEMTVSTRELVSGHWRILVDWSDGERDYFTESVLVL
ncbi:MAG: FixH family protein [Bacteroidota bacterium]